MQINRFSGNSHESFRTIEEALDCWNRNVEEQNREEELWQNVGELPPLPPNFLEIIPDQGAQARAQPQGTAVRAPTNTAQMSMSTGTTTVTATSTVSSGIVRPPASQFTSRQANSNHRQGSVPPASSSREQHQGSTSTRRMYQGPGAEEQSNSEWWVVLQGARPGVYPTRWAASIFLKQKISILLVRLRSKQLAVEVARFTLPGRVKKPMILTWNT
jgi:hypothetical protein